MSTKRTTLGCFYDLFVIWKIWIERYSFSSGFVDWLLSFNASGALNGWMLVLLGLAAFVVYYVIFRFLITKLNIKTPGREDEIEESEKTLVGDLAHAENATLILEALGGKDNIVNTDYCVTRLRFDVKDSNLVDEDKMKKAKTAGLIKTSKTSVQVVIGPQVQFVAEEFKKLVK